MLAQLRIDRVHFSRSLLPQRRPIKLLVYAFNRRQHYHHALPRYTAQLLENYAGLTPGASLLRNSSRCLSRFHKGRPID